jgi:hypothetical protein
LASLSYVAQRPGRPRKIVLFTRETPVRFRILQILPRGSSFAVTRG